MAKGKLVPIPQVAAAQVAGEQLAGVGQAVVKAATTPIYERKTVEVWDPEGESWQPLTREKGVQVTPAAIGVVGLLGLGVAAVAQRAIRTGTVGKGTQDEFLGVVAGGRNRKVWVASGSLPQGGRTVNGNTEVFTRTGRTRTVPTLRTRDAIADYQPIGGLR